MDEQALTSGDVVSEEVQEGAEEAVPASGASAAPGYTTYRDLRSRSDYRVRNETPKRLRLEFVDPQYDGEETVVLAPLEERKWTVESGGRTLQTFQNLEARGLISYARVGTADRVDLGSLATALFVAVFVYFVFANAFVGDNPALTPWLFIYVPAGGALIAIIGLFLILFGSTTLWRQTQHAIALFLVLFTGVGVTGAVIYYFGDGQRLLGEGTSLALLGRALQFIFIAVASLFPALLYFWFDRSRLGTLRRNFERVIFRLDPTVATLRDVYTKYGDQLDELFGHDPVTARGRQTPGTRSPIWLAVLVISIGWILVLVPVTGSPAEVEAYGLLAFFLPEPSVIGFGFLGAYYFALFSVARRYTRGDLKPKAYSHIVTRIFIVVILGWVLTAVFGDRPISLALVFLVGVLPETFWLVMGEVGRNEIWGRLFRSQQQKDPLTNLDGIDTYDRARLAEEGVTNVESLAHHDLVDLILATRIPVARIVYWVDQAILYVHLTASGEPLLANGGANSQAEAGQNGAEAEANGRERTTLRQRLHRYGIRTATDFMQVYERAEERGELPRLFSLLGEDEDGDDQRTSQRTLATQILFDTLSIDEWLPHIQHWRATTAVVEEARIVVDGHGHVGSLEPTPAPQLPA